MVTGNESAACRTSGCGIASLLNVLAGQWTMYIIWTLNSEGALRFGELKQKIDGISAKVLTERLRLLEAEGFITRTFEAAIPPRVTYSPTARLAELSPVLCQLGKLAESWYGDRFDAPVEIVPEE
jgi:DNA-binding HxlR family transcriptional regulator